MGPLKQPPLLRPYSRRSRAPSGHSGRVTFSVLTASGYSIEAEMNWRYPGRFLVSVPVLHLMRERGSGCASGGVEWSSGPIPRDRRCFPPHRRNWIDLSLALRANQPRRLPTTGLQKLSSKCGVVALWTGDTGSGWNVGGTGRAVCMSPLVLRDLREDARAADCRAGLVAAVAVGGLVGRTHRRPG